MSSITHKHRQIWQRKSILRTLYHEWYKKIIADLSTVKGPTVEVGAGSGNFKSFYPKVIATDIVPFPWLDLTIDAHAMPFKKKSIANFVMIDVLHHFANPIGFFEEAATKLQSGGRIIMLEPYPSPFSSIIYKLFHPEPFIYTRNYFAVSEVEQKDPWDSNQAIPYLLFFRDLEQFEQKFKNIYRVRKRERLSLIAYALSGGFENNPLVPELLITLLMKVERKLSFLAAILGFRCYIIIERL